MGPVVTSPRAEGISSSLSRSQQRQAIPRMSPGSPGTPLRDGSYTSCTSCALSADGGRGARRYVFVVNPKGALGRAGRQWGELWPYVEEQAQQAGAIAEQRLTEFPGHAAEIARECQLAGYDVVVAVGGDGSINEVANGLLSVDQEGNFTPATTVLGIVPLGTGSDYVKTFGWASGLETVKDAVRRVFEGQEAAVDAGVVTAVDGATGERRTRAFVNVASCGISASTADLVNRSRVLKSLGSKLAYDVASVIVLLTKRGAPLTLRLVDLGEEVPLRAATLTAFGVGQCFGSGMRICPRADPRDGLLDVISLDSFGAYDFIRVLPMIKDGSYLDYATATYPDRARYFRSRDIEVICRRPAESAGVLIELEGDVLGHAPFRIRTFPGALKIVQ